MQFVALLLVGIALFVAGARAEEPQEGFRWTPDLGWRSGDHALRLGLQHRYRWERWEAFNGGDWEGFHAFRTRASGEYRWRDRLRIYAEGQHTALVGLGKDASGPANLYRSNTRSGSSSSATSWGLSQLYAEWSFEPGSWLRVGREQYNMGTFLGYEEADWRFLKNSRLSQRLVGTVGWTHGTRSYDGVNVLARVGGHSINAFGFEPTTGVWDVEDAFKRNRDVLLAGVDWTVERGTWLENTELGAFFIWYEDDRNADRVSGLFGDIEVYTLGASWLGVYDVGPGRLDVLVWGAYQFGDYVDEGPDDVVGGRDQRAGAFIAEVGYRLPDLPGAPWIRLGVNYASGDDDLDNDTRHTFFNMLPTNHLYYGYLDQLAFQNLVDLLLQLRASPLPGVSLDLTYHHFWLAEREDFRWSGTGAFNRGSLGFVRNDSGNERDVGHELDLTAVWKAHDHLSVRVGYSHFWGRSTFENDDANWLYAQLSVSY